MVVILLQESVHLFKTDHWKEELVFSFLYNCNMPEHASCVIHSTTIPLSSTRPGHYAELRDSTTSASAFSK